MALLEEFESQGKWLFRYRSWLPISVLLIGWFLFLQMKKFPGNFIPENTVYELPYEWFCYLVGFIGLFIRIYTVGHTPANTSGRNTAEGQVADTVNTAGIYSTVRHPLYLGNFFMWLGPALLTQNIWFIVSFCLAFWIYYERIMFAEEQFLREKFGPAYTDWAIKTNAFIPSFSGFIPPKEVFSWKKVIKKEKNGILALLLIYSLFDISGNLIIGKNDFNYILIAAFIVSLVLYIILKIIKNQTQILNEAGR